MEQPRPDIQSLTAPGFEETQIRLPSDVQIESNANRGLQARTQALLFEEFHDHVVQRTVLGFNSPIFLISRGAEIRKDGTVVPATFGRRPVSPDNGSLASGESRVVTIAAALEMGLLNTTQIIATSGEATARDPVTREPITINYGEAHKTRLQELGVTHSSNGEDLTIDVQHKSNDTFGEVMATPGYLRHRLEEDTNFAAEVEKSGRNITFFSSDDQLPRIATLEVLTELQGKTPEEMTESIAFLREQLENGPVVRYIKTYRDQIIDLVKTQGDRKIKEQLLKTLFLIDNVEDMTHPALLKESSDGLFQNPRFEKTIERCAPNLIEDLQWMQAHGIKIQHLTTEEVIIAMHKRVEAGLQSGDPQTIALSRASERTTRKLMRWLSHIYGPTPDKNELLPTFLMELGGITDFLTEFYYAQGDKAQHKAHFVEALSNAYEIPLDEPLNQ